MEQRYQVSGEVDFANADQMRTQLMSMVRETHADLVVDCEGLSFIDKTAVSVFASVAALLARADRRFRVVNLHGNARRKIEVLGLTELFSVDGGPRR